MSQEWNDDQPIYRQIRDRIVSLILQGVFKAGDPIPSVRQLSKDYQINHLTVSKAYQELVNEQWVEKRRGLGMFVMAGACCNIRKKEQLQFLESELPAFVTRINELQMDLNEVIEKIRELDGGQA